MAHQIERLSHIVGPKVFNRGLGSQVPGLDFSSKQGQLGRKVRPMANEFARDRPTARRTE